MYDKDYNKMMKAKANSKAKSKTKSKLTSKKKATAKKKIDPRLMEDKTSSKIPKTPREKKMWIRAREIAVKQSGAKSEKGVPWELVTTIYKDAKKADKIPRKSDVTYAKKDKAAESYYKPDEKKSKAKSKTKSKAKAKVSVKKTVAKKAAPKKKDKDFIQSAVKEMKAKGTKGAFSAKAKKAGDTTSEYANKVLKKGSKASAKTKKQAVFAKNMIGISRKNKKKK
jgi:hypothetical protein